MTTSKQSARGKQPRAAAKRTPRKATATLPKPLKVDDVFKTCPSSTFSFSNTKSHPQSHDIISQDRAIKAINLGLGIRKPGYNIYVAGYQGTGKTSVIKSFLERWSKSAETPNDWVYVYNYEDAEKPLAIEMKTGEGRKLRKMMESLIKALREDIPAALQSEDYENAVNSYLSASNDRKAKLFTELEKLAKSMDFGVKSTRVGIETVPIVDGRPLSEKEYAKLDDKKREDLESKRGRLEPEVLDFARKVRSINSESKEYIEALRSEVGNQIVSIQLEPIAQAFQHNEQIFQYLEATRAHILENLLDFAEDDDDSSEEDQPVHYAFDSKEKFKKYQINVFVDNTNTKGAPVVIETNPTYYNLFGKVEKNVEHGMFLTDHSMVKNGAIHRANGGYLVINAMDIFKTHNIWETLKRVLRNGEAFIEDPGEQYSMLPTTGLRPSPFPINVKVIMIGNDDIYHVLFEDDEDFRKIFKIKADFDYRMERNKRNVNSYASFVATRSAKEELLHFDKSGVSAIVEFGSRLVEDQRYLSCQFGEIKDVTIEADFCARQSESKVIRREHVEQALDSKFYRLNLVEQHILDMIRHEDLLLSVDGERIGQVNGLTVYDMGDISFGKIARITCATAISDDGILNIERASRLSGKTYDKGMYIVAGFLNGLLARERSLGISASIAFEQSYGIVDGDSASIAELITIISAMAGIPCSQSFAITGSVNQMGEVQPVGGVNEKIEGFFKCCRLIGKKRSGYGVLLPAQNVPSLMLHREVREAMDSGFLKVYAIRHLWEAFELVTGVPLGIADFHDKDFAPGSALDIIKKKLSEMHKKADTAPVTQHHEQHLLTPKSRRAAKTHRALPLRRS